MTHHALVRRPSPRLADGLVTHIGRSPVDVALAQQQWVEYVAALEANGWATTEVAPAPGLPDSAFVEDTMVVFRDVVVLARPGADERKPEVAAAAEAVRRFGYREVTIEAPGTLDGGDVLKVGDTIYVGNGGRTNQAGIAQLAAAFEPLGATVVTVPLNKVLHLKSAVTALPDGTIIGWEPAIDDISVFPRFLGMPEESGSHVVLLGGDKVLMSSDCPRSAVLLRSAGLEPVLVDISEFIKLEGCVTCLSVRLREAPHAPQH
ncbi:MAG: N(G),N(G)-dimethylarginine dimethylaminohydrolase [Acidimicrobiaceae bacterium]|jgi:dimethylargininase|nr:N(G),N(G)-dimethylarginine dimethylaminohydrolase [Acidimicrobiaceae bacterium]HRA85204.1 arginine deiminase family protein [Ilumatobacteraceae bacterium]HRC48518.1 arginine deiminase family protein [Ilumatobacteraceae bacterium]